MSRYLAFLALSWRWILDRPGRTLTVLCLTQLVVWTVVPVLVDRTPTGDALEEILWGREWMLLSYKHPQLPGWGTKLGYYLTGSDIWGGYLMPQLFLCLTFVLVFRLGRDLMGSRAAMAGVLILPVTGFFGEGARQLNHDIAQLPFWAAIAWLLWRAATPQPVMGRANGTEPSGPPARTTTGWWLALGLVAGLGLYAKFSTGLIMAFGGLWLLADPQARRQLHHRGPWLALAIVIAFAIPLLVLLVRDNFMQFSYVSERNDWVQEHRGRFYYIGVQAALLALVPVALVSSGLWRRSRAGEPGRLPLLTDRRARHYLLWMGLGPALMLAAVSPFVGIGEAWGKTMYNLIGLVAVAYLGARLSDRVFGRLALWGFAMVFVTAGVYATTTTIGCNRVTAKISTKCLPGPAMAAHLQQVWHDATRAPLRIVGGREEFPSVVGALASDRPSAFTDLSMQKSPWITPARLARDGLLIVWGEGPPIASFQPFIGDRPVRQARFETGPGRPPIVVSYVIVPPGALTVPPSDLSASRSPGMKETTP